MLIVLADFTALAMHDPSRNVRFIIQLLGSRHMVESHLGSGRLSQNGEGVMMWGVRQGALGGCGNAGLRKSPPCHVLAQDLV